MVLQMTSCCCGCSLKTGTVIIGILSVIAAVAGLVINILEASGTMHMHSHEDRQVKDLNSLVNELESGESTTPGTHVPAALDLDAATFPAIHVILAILDAIHLILATLLIVGVVVKRPNFIKPWIMYSIMSIVAQTILSLVTIIYGFINGVVLAGVLALVFVAVLVAIGVYFILVVNSYHIELSSRAPYFQNCAYKI